MDLIYIVGYGIKIKGASSPETRTKTIRIGSVPELTRIGALGMLAQPPNIPTRRDPVTGQGPNIGIIYHSSSRVKTCRDRKAGNSSSGDGVLTGTLYPGVGAVAKGKEGQDSAWGSERYRSRTPEARLFFLKKKQALMSHN